MQTGTAIQVEHTSDADWEIGSGYLGGSFEKDVKTTFQSMSLGLLS